MIGAKVVEPGLGKPSASPPLKPLRASRRHPNSCCGVIPCCRATSETTAPGCWLSSTMRALASGDQRRRRPTPVITSMRCKPSGAPSPRSVVGLSVLPSRCLLMGSHYGPCRTRPGRWVGITAYLASGKLPLPAAQLALSACHPPRALDGLAVAQGDQVRQAEVDAHAIGTGPLHGNNLDMKDDVPLVGLPREDRAIP